MNHLTHPWSHTVMVKGGGDVASGVILRLHRAGFRTFFTEVERPLSVRRTVCFSEAVYNGFVWVEGVKAVLAHSPNEITSLWEAGVIPGLIDPEGEVKSLLRPDVLVDATMAKQNLGTFRGHGTLTIGLGPGFCAGKDVDLVVETKRGHLLGRVIREGEAEPNTGEPEPVMGYSHERVIRAPKEGTWRPLREIGDQVKAGDLLGKIDEVPVIAPISGMVRGLLHEGLLVPAGIKLGDVDPRGIREYCWRVSDKALAVGGGVLEAIMEWCFKNHVDPSMKKETYPAGHSI